MISFSKLQVSIIALAALVVFQMGCENPDQVKKDMKASISTETEQFANLKAAQEQAGNIVTVAYKNWIVSLSRLASVSADLARIISNAKPEEKSKHQADVDALRSQLDNILQRNDSVKLLVPAWDLKQCEEQRANYEAALTSITSSYASLYGQNSNAVKFTIALVKDDRLLDTKGDCVTLFENDAADCKAAAVDGCGHQMDLDCVAKSARSNGGFGYLKCSETKVDTDIDTNRSNSKSTSVETATWLKTCFSVCASAKPIFK
jgi:hypothetical protein